MLSGVHYNYNTACHAAQNEAVSFSGSEFILKHNWNIIQLNKSIVVCQSSPSD